MQEPPYVIQVLMRVAADQLDTTILLNYAELDFRSCIKDNGGKTIWQVARKGTVSWDTGQQV